MDATGLKTYFNKSGLYFEKVYLRYIIANYKTDLDF